MSIIEKELRREHLFMSLVKRIDRHHNDMNLFKTPKGICILSRYIINKIPFRKETDDPVFITSRSEMCDRQIKLDYEYYNIQAEPNDLIRLIEFYFGRYSNELKEKKFRSDSKVIKLRSELRYKDHRFQYIRCDENLDVACAIRIRYRYIFNDSFYFSPIYENFDMKPNDQCYGETCVTALTRYFREFAGFFPDLETVFGSRESLFDYDNWTADIIFLKPHFDVVFIERLIDEMLKSKKTFHIMLPNWKDVEKITTFRQKCTFESSFKMNTFIGYNRLRNIQTDIKSDILYLRYN